MQNLNDIQDILSSIIDIQYTDGNWNYDVYNYGLLIGLLIAKSILDGDGELDLPSAPEKWIKESNEEKLFLEKLKKYPMVKEAYLEYCVLRALSGFDDED